MMPLYHTMLLAWAWAFFSLLSYVMGIGITKCVDDIRSTEAKDSLKKLVGWPLGIKIDPKNFSGSLKDGLLKKLPFQGKKEEDEQPLSDEEMVTKFLGKVFLPILFSIISILVFGPSIITIIVAVIGGIFAIKGEIEVLFSNNKSGAFNSKEEKKEWDNDMIERIRDILKTPIKGSEKSEQPRRNLEESE